MLYPKLMLPQPRWSSLVLWGIAGLVTTTLLLPTLYLLVRVLDTDAAAWQNLLRFRTVAIIARTVWLAGAVTVCSALIAVPLAWLTTRTDLPLRRMWGVLAPLPLVIPSYVGAYLMASALGPRGLVQQALETPLGITRLPNLYGFPGATITLTLLSYPYIYLGVRAALLKMDPALEEASRSLGYSSWETFRRITLPHLRPALGASGLLVALYALRDFGAVSIMRYDTFTRVIYQQYQSFDRSQAALFALVLLLLTLGLLALEARWHRGRARYDQTSSPRPPIVMSLGRWRWPALGFCGAVVFFSLVLPTVLLAYWLVRGLSLGETIPALSAAVRNSMLASSLGAVVTVGAALPVAILVVRRPSRLTQGLERLTYSVFALPGIVVALALVFFGVRYALPLYQTLPMLLLAYGILFLPQSVGAVRTALLQIHPQLEETACSLGHRPWRVLLTVTLPLVRSGVLAGAGLVFLTVMKELPATLILAPIGFRTLATGVWSAVSEAYFAQAAAPALLLILMSSLPMAFMVAREQRADL